MRFPQHLHPLDHFLLSKLWHRGFTALFVKDRLISSHLLLDIVLHGIVVVEEHIVKVKVSASSELLYRLVVARRQGLGLVKGLTIQLVHLSIRIE